MSGFFKQRKNPEKVDTYDRPVFRGFYMFVQYAILVDVGKVRFSEFRGSGI
jgi:hypothetical protein